MELINYLNGESDELSELRLSCVDQRNSLALPDKLKDFGDHCYADIRSDPSDWIKTESDPNNDLPLVDVDSHKAISSLVESTMLAIDGNDSFRIKLSLNRDSIKFLRRSLKLVKDRLESTQSRTKRKWQSKVDSYMESIKSYDKTDHQSSTDESESENESRMPKKAKRESSFENKSNAEKITDGINGTLEKRFELQVANRKNFWFYTRNLIQDGRIQVTNFPINICSYTTEHLEKRIEMSTKLNPDPYAFAHVQHKVPWDESNFEQLLVSKIPKETAERVLKGMSQGKLYLIDYTRVSQIFRGLVKEETNGKCKCPLCGKLYSCRASVMGHLESLHTNFACFCGRCGHFFLRNPSIRIHNCPSK